MRRRPSFRQADISRALRGARKAGLIVARVEINEAGTIAVVAGTSSYAVWQGEKNEWDEVFDDEAAPTT